MIRSMTGYGRCKELIDGYDISIEMRCVNHRYADFSIRLPKYYNFLENKIRERVSKFIKRGKLEISIYIRQENSNEKQIFLNESLCRNYYDALTAMKDMFGIAEEISIQSLTRFNDIFDVEYKEADEDKVIGPVFSALDKCMEKFLSMRENEGERISEDISKRLDAIGELTKEIEKRAPKIINDYKERLTLKLKEILVNLDEQRILQEAAIYADRITTAEETVRLSSHINEFRITLSKGGAMGKQLDFLTQEMNREINTVGSKCNDFETSKIVVKLKSEIENIREQIQNIE